MLDHVPLLRAQRPRLAQDVAGHADLSYVVQARRQVELHKVVSIHLEALPDAHGQPHHRLRVLGGVPVPDPERGLQGAHLHLGESSTSRDRVHASRAAVSSGRSVAAGAGPADCALFTDADTPHVFGR